MTEYKIIFKQIKGSDVISYNISSILGAALHKMIGKVNPKVGDFIHNQGYAGNHRRFKLLTHRVRPLDYQTLTEGILLRENRLISWNIRFYDQQLANQFLKACLLEPIWELGDVFGHHVWEIIKSEKVSHKPKFQNIMNYQLVSPVVISVPNEKTRKPYYLNVERHGEMFLNQIKKHLENKSRLLYEFGKAKDGLEEGLEDLDFRILNNSKTKTLVFKETLDKPQRIKASTFDFELIAPKEVQEMIYYGGFMEKTAMGCGFVKILES